jgi:hypothetical protein
MLNQKRTKIILFIAILGAVLLWGHFALAQVNTGIEELGGVLPLGREDIRIIIAKIVRIFLGLLGTIAVAIVVYGGFIWMTAAGEPKKVDKAKDILKAGVIGLLIILASFAITQFIFSSLFEAIYGRGRAVEEYISQYSERLSGSLGMGIIESHYPGRSATDIARNTRIIVTFKEPMNLASIIEDTDGDGVYGSAGDKLNVENVKISTTAERTGGPYVSARAGATADKKSFVFIPDNYLGSPTENVWYTVSLAGGGNGIQKEDGSPAFDGNFAEGYAWEFETGTFLDVIPPKLLSVIPRGGTHPRNIVIQMNFSEAVDPTSASGIAEVAGDILSGFTNLAVTGDGTPLAGTFSIGNEYKTVEFMTNDFCGTNSCGGDVFCLPPDSNITALIKAATLSSTPPSAEFPYDGVVDLAGNSFDGSGDGIASGPPDDNATSTFKTNNTIDLRPPKIISIFPEINAGGVALDNPVFAIFDKVMSATTLNTANLMILSEPVYEYWFAASSANLNQNNEPTLDEPSRTKAEIRHTPFAPSTDEVRFDYFTSISSAVKDLMQNCYFPGVGPSAGGVCEASSEAPYCCDGTPSRNKCEKMP